MLASWFPTVPTWDGLHPALVQFPLGLLLVAPVLVLISLVAKTASRAWAGSALLVMGLGMVAAWLAVGSGHAAGQLVEKTPVLQQAILRHEALGVMARNVFTLLVLVYAALLFLPMWLKRVLPEALRIGLNVVFLAVYITSAGVLAHAANAGGHLVHEHGIRGMVQREGQVESTPIAEAPAATAAPTPAAR